MEAGEDRGEPLIGEPDVGVRERGELDTGDGTFQITDGDGFTVRGVLGAVVGAALVGGSGTRTPRGVWRDAAVMGCAIVGVGIVGRDWRG